MNQRLSSQPTAKPALSTIPGGHFVDRRGSLADKRRAESDRALGFLGISRVHYSGLPDGQLYLPKNRKSLTNHILTIVRETKVDAIVTMGEQGFCGHPDHIATHDAARAAQRLLAIEDGVSTPIFALSHDHRGSLHVPVERQKKIAALAMHKSQFGFLSESDELPTTYTHYEPLMIRETYNVLMPEIVK